MEQYLAAQEGNSKYKSEYLMNSEMLMKPKHSTHTHMHARTACLRTQLL